MKFLNIFHFSSSVLLEYVRLMISSLSCACFLCPEPLPGLELLSDLQRSDAKDAPLHLQHLVEQIPGLHVQHEGEELQQPDEGARQRGLHAGVMTGARPAEQTKTSGFIMGRLVNETLAERSETHQGLQGRSGGCQ